MPTEGARVVSPSAGPSVSAASMVMPTAQETFARDAIIAWFRGEFAAANAIIDSLCGHLAKLEKNDNGGAGGSQYDDVFAAIHRRRLNWIPILQMQKYHTIADVAIELNKVAARLMDGVSEVGGGRDILNGDEEKVMENEELNPALDEKTENDGHGELTEEYDSPHSEIIDGGFQEAQLPMENVEICTDHRQCETRPSTIKMTKGFTAKESVKGHMVNVVRGLKLFEDTFTEAELSKLTEFVYELRVAGQNGELQGETFKNFNQQMKGNKRELLQFGVPVFAQIKEEATSKQQPNKIEPIPPLLQNIIDHLVQWRLIPNRKPNSCIINFYDEGEYSQPYLKPPHLDQPISTLLLAESTMAFGCTLVSDNDGNYKAPLTLSLKEGSVLVMRGNSADTAAHAMCPCLIKRATITFFRVRQEAPPLNTSPTPWQRGTATAYPMQNGVPNGFEAMDVVPKWGQPMVIMAPVPSIVSSPKMQQGGTGVFLPWTVGSRKHPKYLPPRAQKGRLLVLPTAQSVGHVADNSFDASISV